jgi:glycosyltransferase
MVSIIVVTFNSEKTICNCINSIQNQKFVDWECILVDGKSTDKTVSLFEEFEKKDKRFRHISEPDSGIYDAMNKGWRMAKGEWIYYLGSDDELLPYGLSGLVESGEKQEKSDVVYGNILYKKENGETVVLRHKSHARLPWSFFASHQAIITKRNLMERLGGFDEKLKIIADKELFIRSYYLGDCKYIPSESVVAVFSGGGSSASYYKSFKEDLYVYKKDKPGIKYLIYAIQHFPRMWFKEKLGMI